MGTDPFGQRTVRANMHPGHQNPAAIGPSGPVDPQITLLSLQALDGRPIALLANYSMHYFGASPVSSDYYGHFAAAIDRLIHQGAPAPSAGPPFVGIMSQGTSGDSMWMDYGKARRRIGLAAYAREVAEVVHAAYAKIRHRRYASLDMVQKDLRLGVRAPDDARLAWAREVMDEFDGFNGGRPTNRPQVYARDQFFLDRNRTRHVRLQALRIGDFGIAAIPCEVYAITGLKLKMQSPFSVQMNMALANGEEGYIPPPEQHRLGGYTTWPTRSAMLEVQAEPKIVEAMIGMLERVSGKPRRVLRDEISAYAQAVLRSRPAAYWRLDEISGAMASDRSGHANNASFHGDLAFFLRGPASPGFSNDQINRAVHLAGGWLDAEIDVPGADYTVESWFWSGLEDSARDVTGVLFSRPVRHALATPAESLAITGEGDGEPGRLVFSVFGESAVPLVGRTRLRPKSWYYVSLVRQGDRVQVYLNGNAEPEIDGHAPSNRAVDQGRVRFGASSDGRFGFEGKLDEVAVYDRALPASEIAAHFIASGVAALSRAQRTPEAEEERRPESQPLSLEAALRSIHVRDGFRVELVAAEPLVRDPVAIDWGADGRLWVAEMADYPSGMDGRGKPGGRIRTLTDTDGDGRYDKSVLFLEDLNFPNGIMTWRGGVLITAAPHILYAEDTDGDGKADVRRTLYSGFLEGNQQLRVNGLRWGLDNWIYCASGAHHAGYGADTGITSTLTSYKTQVGSRDFRIRPDTGQIDPQSGPSQYGRNRDVWGNWFGVQNSHPLWHYVLADHYIRRNPHFVPPDPRRQVVTPSNPRVYPAKKPQKRFHSFQQSGRFTSACSAIVYRDELLFQFGPEQHAFTCEPFHNLVQHNVITREGVSFTFHHDAAEKDVDFFASSDRWCRPVMARTGPDGALWVVDMYRYMIEHPQWLPEAGRRELEPFYRHGEQHGRIYRVYPKGADPRVIPDFTGFATRDLVAKLDSPNGWVRDKVQQLLIRRQDESAVDALRRMASGGEKPLARLHALCTLDGLGALNEAVLRVALADAHPQIRRHAIRLTEGRVASIGPLRRALLDRRNDPDPQVRLQLACSLGTLDGPDVSTALTHLLATADGDTYRIAAVMSSVGERHAGPVLSAAIELPQLAPSTVVALIRIAAAYRSNGALRRVLEFIVEPRAEEATRQWKLLASMMDVVDANRLRELSPEGRTLDAVLLEARTTLFDATIDMERRIAAVGLVAREPNLTDERLGALGGLLGPQTRPRIQTALIARLAKRSDPRIATLLLDRWKSHSPVVRRAIAGVLLSRRPWTQTFLAHIERQDVLAADLDATMRQRMTTLSNKDLRRRAERLLATSTTPDRGRVIETYRAALSLRADPAAGKRHFEQKCATCHRLDGVGTELGPNLIALTDKRPASFLVSILDPSRAVDGKFVVYNAVTTDGRIHVGMITAETGSSITLVTPEGKQTSLLRNELEVLESTGKSLMPDGLEQEASPQDIADLIGFLVEATK
jgi:putative membrane-bound dehydrogenase-like protein